MGRIFSNYFEQNFLKPTQSCFLVGKETKYSQICFFNFLPKLPKCKAIALGQNSQKKCFFCTSCKYIHAHKHTHTDKKCWIFFSLKKMLDGLQGLRGTSIHINPHVAFCPKRARHSVNAKRLTCSHFRGNKHY